MDESPKQVIDYKAFIGKDGTQYQDSEYIRKGVVELSISTQSLVGFRQLTVEDDHKASTWVLFIANLMDTIYKDAIKVTAVADRWHPTLVQYPSETQVEPVLRNPKRYIKWRIRNRRATP